MKVEINKKKLSDMKQSWKFSKAADAENKFVKLLGKDVRKKGRETVKKGMFQLKRRLHWILNER